MSAVTVGSQEAMFGGPLRARGVTRQKSPGLGDLLAAEEGRTGDRSAALRARAGRWSWGRPGAVAQAGKRRRVGLAHKPGSGGAWPFLGSVSGPGRRHSVQLPALRPIRKPASSQVDGAAQ